MANNLLARYYQKPKNGYKKGLPKNHPEHEKQRLVEYRKKYFKMWKNFSQ